MLVNPKGNTMSDEVVDTFNQIAVQIAELIRDFNHSVATGELEEYSQKAVSRMDEIGDPNPAYWRAMKPRDNI